MRWPLLCILAKPSLTDAGQTAMPALRTGKGQGPHLQTSLRGTQGQIHRELQGGRGKEERHTAKHCAGHCSVSSQRVPSMPVRTPGRLTPGPSSGQWGRGAPRTSAGGKGGTGVSTHQHIRQILLRSMVKLTLKKLSKNPFLHKILLEGGIIYASKGFFPL